MRTKWRIQETLPPLRRPRCCMAQERKLNIFLRPDCRRTSTRGLTLEQLAQHGFAITDLRASLDGSTRTSNSLRASLDGSTRTSNSLRASLDGSTRRPQFREQLLVKLFVSCPDSDSAQETSRSRLNSFSSLPLAHHHHIFRLIVRAGHSLTIPLANTCLLRFHQLVHQPLGLVGHSCFRSDDATDVTFCHPRPHDLLHRPVHWFSKSKYVVFRIVRTFAVLRPACQAFPLFSKRRRLWTMSESLSSVASNGLGESRKAEERARDTCRAAPHRTQNRSENGNFESPSARGTAAGSRRGPVGADNKIFQHDW